MREVIHLKTPLINGEAERLRVGDVVYVSGTIYTARDQAHLRIRQLVDEGRELPFDMKGYPIYHAGPNAVDRDGWVIAALGPTTSIRMEPYSSMIASLGVTLIVGKGGMGTGTLEALRVHGMAYLSAPHGCGCIGAEAVMELKAVYWLDLGIPEAVWRLKMKNWGPLIVGMDSQGGHLYRDAVDKALKKIEVIYGV